MSGQERDDLQEPRLSASAPATTAPAGPAAEPGGSAGGDPGGSTAAAHGTPSTAQSSAGFVPEIPRRTLDLPGAAGRRAGAQSRTPPESKKLIVGREISLSGEITACETLLVEGSVEATLENSHLLEISDSGRFKGKVQINDAIIAGQFEGALIVRDRLLVKSTGRIQGSIRFGRLEVELGGEVEGDIRVLRENEGDDASDAAAS